MFRLGTTNYEGKKKSNFLIPGGVFSGCTYTAGVAHEQAL